METNNVENVTEVLVEKPANILKDEKILKTLALIILVIGVIATLILLFTVVVISNQQYYYDGEGNILEGSGYTDRVFNASGLAAALGTLFSSVVLWAFFNVISNISISLKDLKALKEKE